MEKLEWLIKAQMPGLGFRILSESFLNRTIFLKGSGSKQWWVRRAWREPECRQTRRRWGGSGPRKDGAWAFFYGNYFMKIFLHVCAWVSLARIQINLHVPFWASQGSCSSAPNSFWLLKEKVYVDIVIKIEGTSAAESKWPLSLCFKTLSCPCEPHSFDPHSAGFEFPTKCIIALHYAVTHP